VAVVVAVGLTAPLVASDVATAAGDLQPDLLSSMDQTTLDILSGLSEVEDSASPSLPPGLGGTPPGKPVGPGSESRPPEFAQNDKEKDKDKDKDNEEEEEEQDED
jgi:hypothetical protein